jgi:hypothetical protein
MDGATVGTIHPLPPKKRSVAFNAFFKAIVRQMPFAHSEIDTANAMEKSGSYIGHGRV